jgi:type IV secretory pathway VirB10-like protein
MMPEPPPNLYRTPDPPPGGPPPADDPDIYGPLRPPVPPVRVRLLKLVLVLMLAVGGLIGTFVVARRAGWLQPVQQAARYDTDGQAGIKSTIKYPVEPKALLPAASNGGDPDPEWKRWVRGRLSEHDAKLTDHEARIKRLEELTKGQKPPPTQTQAQAQAQQPPKAKPYRSMQFISNKIELKKTEDPDAHRLAAGQVLPCVEQSAVNSDVTDSYFTAKVRNDVYDTDTGHVLLVPQGSTIVGKYHSRQLLFGNERLPTTSLRLAIPNRDAVEIGDAPVVDHKGQAGLVSRVDHHYWRLFSAVVIMGVLRGGQQAIQYQLGANDPAAAIASGMAGSANQVGQMRIGPALNTKPTITVEAGEPCNVLLIKELRLPDYRQG